MVHIEVHFIENMQIIFILLLILCYFTSGQPEEVQVTSDGSTFKSNAASNIENAEFSCKDENVNCPFWMEVGECQKNPGYMLYNCAHSCNSCEILRNKWGLFCTKEFLKIQEPPVYQPGDLDRVLSSIPSNFSGIFGEINVLSTSPWVLTIDNFLTESEMTALLTFASDWNLSGASSALIDRDGNSIRIEKAKRNSQTGWCRTETCKSVSQDTSFVCIYKYICVLIID